MIIYKKKCETEEIVLKPIAVVSRVARPSEGRLYIACGISARTKKGLEQFTGLTRSATHPKLHGARHGGC